MEGALEYFLIRTLPSRKKPLRKMFGNPATPSIQRKLAGIRMELSEREAVYFKDVFEGTSNYSPAMQSHILSVVNVKGCDHKSDGVYAIASLRGSLKGHGYMATRMADRSLTCFTNFKSQDPNYLRSAFAYKNLLGICTHEHFLIYDVPRMHQGAMIGIKGCFGATCIYRNEVWVILQSKRMYFDSEVALLDTKKIQSWLQATPEVSADVFSPKVKFSSSLFSSSVSIDHRGANETTGIVVDRFQIYLAYRSELLVLNKKTSKLEKKVKYPESNIDGVAGRGTKVVYVSTKAQVTAFKTPQLERISSVDTFDKKERKILSVKLVRGIELVFAVGHSTGGVSIFSLLDQKMLRICRAKDLKDNPLKENEPQGFPGYFVDESCRNLYLYGHFKPVRFRIRWP